MSAPPHRPSRTALFVPCSTAGSFPGDVDAQRRLLSLAGHPGVETFPVFYCGQPAATAGDAEGARAMGRVWAERAKEFDAVFVASATCCGQLRRLLEAEGPLRYAPDAWIETIRARCTLPRVSIYLHRPCHDIWDDARFEAYRRWVADTAGAVPIDRPYNDPCCGFGGVFSTLFDETAGAMVGHRLKAIEKAGASVVVSAEPGCLGHFAAHASTLRVVPLATFLVSRGIA